MVPGQNVAPMNTHDRLQNRLQARHIVPGQYMSWDKMSRDKMSPDHHFGRNVNMFQAWPTGGTLRVVKANVDF